MNHMPYAFGAARYGNVIKIDDPADMLPAGQGPGWLMPIQTSINLAPEHDWSNPASVFSFRLNLDGMPGTREIVAHLWWHNSTVPPNYFVGVYSNLIGAGLARAYVLPTTIAPPLRITVLCPADVDDGTGTGTPDLGVTADALLSYLARYELGC